jgi:AcrR family transcriptional regulator
MQEKLTRADARANRARLIEAAVAVLAEEGVNAEMRRIAERAGVSTGTLYRNFPTKDDLLLAMFSAAVEHLREALRQAAAEQDPLAAIRTLLEGGFALTRRFGLLAAFAGVSEEQRERLRHEDIHAELVHGVTALVRRAMAAGVLRRDRDVEFTAWQLLSLFEPRVVRRYGGRWSIDQLVEMSLEYFLQGAGSGADTAPERGSA